MVAISMPYGSLPYNPAVWILFYKSWPPHNGFFEKILVSQKMQIFRKHKTVPLQRILRSSYSIYFSLSIIHKLFLAMLIALLHFSSFISRLLSLKASLLRGSNPPCFFPFFMHYPFFCTGRKIKSATDFNLKIKHRLLKTHLFISFIQKCIYNNDLLRTLLKITTPSKFNLFELPTHSRSQYKHHLKFYLAVCSALKTNATIDNCQISFLSSFLIFY